MMEYVFEKDNNIQESEIFNEFKDMDEAIKKKNEEDSKKAKAKKLENEELEKEKFNEEKNKFQNEVVQNNIADAMKNQLLFEKNL